MSLRQGSATAYGSVEDSLSTSLINRIIPGALPPAIHGLPFPGMEKTHGMATECLKVTAENREAI